MLLSSLQASLHHTPTAATVVSAVDEKVEKTLTTIRRVLATLQPALSIPPSHRSIGSSFRRSVGSSVHWSVGPSFQVISSHLELFKVNLSHLKLFMTLFPSDDE